MVSGVFWSIWRRLFGEGEFKKVINRTVQIVIAVAVLSLQLCWQQDISKLLIAIPISVWVIIQYWSRAVGEIIDSGLNNNQNADSYDRWFRIPLDWIYDKLGKQKYVGTYDFWYSCIRYGIGAIPLCYYSWWALALIPLHYPIYLFVHKLYNKYPKMYQLKYTLNEPKNLAEIIHGFCFGLIVGLM